MDSRHACHDIFKYKTIRWKSLKTKNYLLETYDEILDFTQYNYEVKKNVLNAYTSIIVNTGIATGNQWVICVDVARDINNNY